MRGWLGSACPHHAPTTSCSLVQPPSPSCPPGLHPWWSHHISFADPDSDSSTQSIDKKSHYAGLFPGCFDNVELQQSMEEDGGPDLMSALYNSFPEPTLFRDYCANTLQPYLEAFPSAMLGEVGLDRSFRIPVPTTEAKTDREQDRAAKKFTELKIPVPHQLELLRRQMELAFQLNRNISMHSVQAQGQTVELITKLDKTSQRWKTSRSKICLHSYGGSTDTVAMLSRADRERIYFSFSTTINGRLERLGELIRAVPDDRLLIESDYNDIRVSEKRLWEILGVVCHAKGWEREQGAKQLARNWQRFTRQDGEGGEL